MAEENKISSANFPDDQEDLNEIRKNYEYLQKKLFRVSCYYKLKADISLVLMVAIVFFGLLVFLYADKITSNQFESYKNLIPTQIIKKDTLIIYPDTITSVAFRYRDDY